MLKTAFNRSFHEFINVLAMRFNEDDNLRYLNGAVKDIVESEPQTEIFFQPFQQAVKPLLERIRAKDESVIMEDTIKPLSALKLPELWPKLEVDEKDALWIYLKKLADQAVLIQTVNPQLAQFEELAGSVASEFKSRNIDFRQAAASGNLMPLFGQLYSIFKSNPAIHQSLDGIVKSFEQNPAMQDDVSRLLDLKRDDADAGGAASGRRRRRRGGRGQRDTAATAGGEALDMDALNRSLDDAEGSEHSDSESYSSDSGSSSSSSDGSDADTAEPRAGVRGASRRARRAAPADDAKESASSEGTDAVPSAARSERRRTRRATAAAAGPPSADGGDGMDVDQFMQAYEALNKSGKLQQMLSNMGVPIGTGSSGLSGTAAAPGQSLAGPRGSRAPSGPVSASPAAAPALAVADVDVD